MEAIRRISFYVNSTKPGADDVCARLSSIAAASGIEVSERSPDAVVVLGGDGTMLAAVHRFPSVPLVGFNLGSLGYLAAVEEPDFANVVRSLAEGRYRMSMRSALEVRGRIALNDAVVSRGVSGHAASIELSVDGRAATRYSADGIVIATPTGSTAYSLSAGGPILLPDSRSFAVTPICPHALASRPLVVPDSSVFALRALARPGVDALEVFADGQSVGRLEPGEELRIAKAGESVPLIQPEGYDPYLVLGRKLGWSGSSIS